ncbi:sigma factor [Actinoallomurus sp. NPDC050550]|uniref:RNA polymerase sigma factor n=1 Tax=Actinoallomurus sp. NPDC050550 TaxID=3154937 RepID=UPI0033EED9F9
MDDESRFRALFDSAYPALHRYAANRGLSGPDGDDLVAGTLEIAWRRIDEVPLDDPLPWLYAVARNLMRNQRRRESRRAAILARFRSSLAQRPEAGNGDPGVLHPDAIALRTARPETAEHTAMSPAAQALLTRIVGARTAGARRRRPRRWTIGVPLGVAAAVTAAVGITMTDAHRTPATDGSPPSPSTLRGAILAAFDGNSGTIMHTRLTTTTEKSVAETWTYPATADPGQQRRTRFLDLDAAGAPKQDSSMTYTMPPSGGSAQVRVDVLQVEYTTRTWSHETTTIGIAGEQETPDHIRRDIADGHFTVRRGIVLDGRRTIELTWSLPTRGTTHLWVDAKTYLPVKSIYEFRQSGRVPLNEITTYESLPATSTNLARLRPVVPAGFVRTRVPQRPTG